MASSGTTTFNLDLTQVVEEAYERVGVEMRSGYDLRTARRSLNLMFADWANRGLNMWTFEQGTIFLIDGTSTYVLPPDTVDLMEIHLRTGTGTAQLDRALDRISMTNYADIPNKNYKARPTQVLVDRVGNPQVVLWPIPNASSTYTLVYWRLRRIQDAGTGVNTMDVPFRFLPALVAGLAYYLAMKVPGGMERLQFLKMQYDEAWVRAAEEDREKTSIRFVPRIAR
jgi:hypothetical protein